MKMIKYLLFMLFTFNASSALAGELTPLEEKRQYLVYATLAIDAAQTLDIKNHPELHESNPILGRHPSDAKIVTYFVAAGYAHYSITKALPTEYRAAWQYGWAALQIATIVRNRKLNLRMNF